MHFVLYVSKAKRVIITIGVFVKWCVKIKSAKTTRYGNLLIMRYPGKHIASATTATTYYKSHWEMLALLSSVDKAVALGSKHPIAHNYT